MVKFTLNVEFNLSEHNLVEILWCYIPQNVKKKAKRGKKEWALCTEWVQKVYSWWIVIEC